MTASDMPAGRFDARIRMAEDAWTHSRSASDWSHQYEQLAVGPFQGMHSEAWLGPLQICYERVDGSFKYRGRAWPGSRLFFSFRPGSGDIYYDGRPVASEMLLTHRWDAVGTVTCSRRAEILVVAVDEAFLDQHASLVAGRTFFEDDDGSPVVCTRDKSLVTGFEQSVADALRVIRQTPSLLSNERDRYAIQRSILDSLCNILLARSPVDFRLPVSSTRAYVVDKAIQFIESKLADQLAISDVCTAVRVCPRTLRYSFEHVLGITPTQYIRAARLSRVRSDLVTGRQVSIQCTAARWGFWHMGRFASYYHQTFGEHPSSTIHTAWTTRGRQGRSPPPIPNDTAGCPPLPYSF
jgi:AraC family transcriptional regulator, ethanolamine operon transcriptional activator